jgi:hypothetical protein
VFTVLSSTVGRCHAAIGDRVVTDLYVLIVLLQWCVFMRTKPAKKWHTQCFLHVRVHLVQGMMCCCYFLIAPVCRAASLACLCAICGTRRQLSGPGLLFNMHVTALHLCCAISPACDRLASLHVHEHFHSSTCDTDSTWSSGIPLCVEQLAPVGRQQLCASPAAA